uniref:Reverse transcriptase/retrotransposon-derived protein RNase H-like domain-containing protein n=1 Tax=Cannabis sativa TaxID=3483 RepID=A0A803Q7B9_CANSA
MPSPKKQKDVQSLTGKVAVLSRFISRSTDKCIPLFNICKKCQKFEWTKECEEAFRKLKEHMAKSPIFSQPIHRADLFLYLAISMSVVSAPLVWEEGKVQHPAHSIKVLTNHPLRQVLQEPEASGRLLKWAMELSQFDIHYVPPISIKGQALEDFIVACNEIEANARKPAQEMSAWKVYVHKASNESGSGAGIAMISPDGLRL